MKAHGEPPLATASAARGNVEGGHRSRSRTIFHMTLGVMVLAVLMAGLEAATIASLPLPLPLSLLKPLQHAAVKSLPWFVCAPLIAAVGVVFRARWRSWPIVAAAHIATCAAMIVIRGAVMWWLAPGAAGPLGAQRQANGRLVPVDLVPFSPLDLPPGRAIPFAEPVSSIDPDGSLWMTILPVLPIYGVFAIVVQALLAFGELKSREVAEAGLRSELARSQLAALRMQVNPHFLFNTLNSISSLIGSNATGARKMLGDLAALLRSSVADSQRQEVPLATELDLVQRYVDIQRIRFGDRLVLQIDAPPALHSALVPALCLQPLIENSIVHAVEKCARPCRIDVRAKREGNLLRISVQDDGPGETEGSVPGIGLQNVRSRLIQLYGDRATMTVELHAGEPHATGFGVTLSLPHHEQAAGGEGDDQR